MQGREKTYEKFDVLGVVLLLVGAAGLGYLWYQTLTWIAGWRLRDLQGVHVLPPPREIFMLSALFLGLCTAPIATEPILRHALGERYAEFKVHSRANLGIGKPRVFAALVAVAVLAAATLAVLGMDFYTVFESDAIVIDRFGSFAEERRPYSSIRAIDRVGDPNQPHFRIEFDDGARWTTRDGGRTTDASDAAAIRYAASRAGMAIGTAEAD